LSVDLELDGTHQVADTRHVLDLDSLAEDVAADSEQPILSYVRGNIISPPDTDIDVTAKRARVSSEVEICSRDL